MRQIADPHCVRVADVIEGPPPTIVTEYIHGAPLRAVLDRAGRLTGPQALDVMRGALLGLIAVHRAGLLHGDFKPDNILVDRAGVSRLIDFGLTRAAASEAAGSAITGSPAYMSPEQVRGDPIDQRSDLYACAAVLFELITGQRPFTGDTAAAVMRRHIDDPVPDAHGINADVSAQLAAVCRTGLAKDPADRYQSAADFLSALEQAARQAYGAAWATGTGVGAVVGATLAISTTQTEPAQTEPAQTEPAQTESAPSKRPRHRISVRAIAVTGVLAIVLAVVAVALLARHRPHRQASASDRGTTAAPSRSPAPSASTRAGANPIGSTSARFASPPSVAANTYNAVSCPTSETCLATGQTGTGRPLVSITDNAGATWTTTFPTVAGSLGLLSCSDTETCVADYYDTAIHMVRTVTPAAPGSLRSPPTSRTCNQSAAPRQRNAWPSEELEANGSGTPQAIDTADGGTSWQVIPIPGPAKSVSCADAAHCWVAGAASIVWATDSAGAAWRPVSPPATFPPAAQGRGPFPANTVFPIHGLIGETRVLRPRSRFQ